MAYFYKHIKGMATDLSIHKINWQSAADGEINLSYVPTFSTYTSNADITGQDYGHLIVSGLNTGFSEKTQNIYTKLKFYADLTIGGSSLTIVSKGSNTSSVTISNDEILVKNPVEIVFPIVLISSFVIAPLTN